MRNLELARTVAEAVETGRKTFRMRNWGVLLKSGEYQACLAGHTLLASGYELADTNMFIHPLYGISGHPGAEAVRLLGMTDAETRRGVHWWKCNVFCENAKEEAALANFRQLIIEEELARLDQHAEYQLAAA